jgi:hypothetical protein
LAKCSSLGSACRKRNLDFCKIRKPLDRIFDSVILLLGFRRGHLPLRFLAEFWNYLKVRKKFWLLPVFAVMIVLGGLLILTQGSAVAPFIYTLF